jgi:hypothetical protein
MANDATNINVSGDAILHFKDGFLPRVEWPTATDTTLAVGFNEFGLTVEAGESINRAVETVSINAHQGSNQRMLATSGTLTIEVTALEDNALTRGLYLGSIADGSGVTTLTPNAIRSGTVVYDTFDIQDGYEKEVRYVGWATVTPNGAVTYSAAEAATFPLLITFQGLPIRIDKSEVEV